MQKYQDERKEKAGRRMRRPFSCHEIYKHNLKEILDIEQIEKEK